MNAKVVGIFGLLVVLSLFMAIASADPWYNLTESTFLKPNNVENLLRRTSLYGILGIGVAFVIITGGIDLSIGSVVCLSGCLLAIFLHVDYRPFDARPVLQVRAAQRQILVAGTDAEFQAGDRIRYFGGRRARPAVRTIQQIERESQNSVLFVDEALTRDDDAGQVAKVCALSRFQHEQVEQDHTRPANVTLNGNYDHLRARDRITLIHSQLGLKEFIVTGVIADETETVVSLAQDLGADFTDGWLAIPLQRQQRMSIPVALLSVVGIAFGLGIVHGLLVTKMKLQPFVVTLCGLLTYRGVSRWLVNDQPVGFGNEFADSLSLLGRGKLVLWQWDDAGRTETFGIPYPFFILLLAAIAAAVFLGKTIWGRYMLALGRNEQAARYSGINTGRIILVAFVISTVLAAIGGMLFALDSNQVPPSSFGNFFELYAIAAAVLGGCSLRGGEGAILGVVFGTAVMQVLNNMIVLLRVSDELEYAIIGLVILLGVLADELVKRVAARRRSRSQARSMERKDLK